jgi:hypothetical protein
MPSRADDETEAVARRLGGADAPACRRRARFQIVRGPQQKQRQAAIDGGEMQPLAKFQIELVDDAGDRGRRARAQRLLDGPQGVVAALGFDQDEALRIKPERGEPVAVKPAMVAKAVSGEDEEKFFRFSWWGRGDDVRQQRRDETKRSGHGLRRRHDFMQPAAGEAAIGKTRIHRGQAEGESLVNIRRAGQQTAQFLHDSGTMARRGTDGGLSQRHVQNYWMFALCSYRTKHELCQGSAIAPDLVRQCPVTA